MVSERPARSRKPVPGALEPEINDFERNLIRKSMVSERSARSRKSAHGALELTQELFMVGTATTASGLLY